MPKPVTVAKLTLNEVIGRQANISTVGTRAGSGTRLSTWSLNWGDNSLPEKGNSYPPIDMVYDYAKDGNYSAKLTVTDTKSKSSSMSVIIKIPPSGAPAVPPQLLQLTPNSGNIGISVTITGLNFGSTQGTSKVYFNGVQATINSWAGTSISTVVPNGTTTGQVTVVVNNQSSNGLTFTVTGGQTYDYIVSTTGNDANSGTLAQPFATIKHALEVASGTLSGTGKVIGVRAGTYNQACDNPAATGTSWTNVLRVLNYEGESVTLHPTTAVNRVIYSDGGRAYIWFDGINVIDDSALFGSIIVGGSGPTVGNLSHHWRFSNLEVNQANSSQGIEVGDFQHNTVGYSGGFEFLNCIVHGGRGASLAPGTYGLYLAAPNCLVDGCELYNNEAAFIHINNSGGSSTQTPDNCIVRNCYFHDLSATRDVRLWGIINFHGTNFQGYNNIIANMTCPSDFHNAAIYTASSSGVSATIYHNTIVNINNGVGILTEDSGSIIRDNICYQCATAILDTTGLATIDHNSTDGTNPQFAGATDYHLTVSTPASIKTGGVAVAAVPSDKDGNLYANPPSIGAYQFF